MVNKVWGQLGNVYLHNTDCFDSYIRDYPFSHEIYWKVLPKLSMLHQGEKFMKIVFPQCQVFLSQEESLQRKTQNRAKYPQILLHRSTGGLLKRQPACALLLFVRSCADITAESGGKLLMPGRDWNQLSWAWLTAAHCSHSSKMLLLCLGIVLHPPTPL